MTSPLFILRHRSAGSTRMTLEEAQLILVQSEAGTLDLSLPGSLALVNQARRVETESYVWGSTRSDPDRRTIRRAVVLGCLVLIATMVGLFLPFITGHA